MGEKRLLLVEDHNLSAEALKNRLLNKGWEVTVATYDMDAYYRIDEASKEGQRLIDRAAQAGDEMKQKAKEDARNEAERLITRAKGEIEKERDDAIGELRKEFADITIKDAEKVIESSLNKETHRKIIEKVLDESAGIQKN